MESKDFVFSDDVTKIFNMRFLLERLKEEIIRAGEVKGCFSIILIDIDHFSAIADTYGRMAADEVLRFFAILLKDFVRKGDIVCTYEDDQFAIILPDADAKHAIRCGNRLLDLLEKKEFALKSTGKDKLKLSVTMGVASYPNAGRDAEELLDNVSHALKQAKQKTTTKISQYRSLEKEKDERIRLNFDRFIGRDASLSLLRASIEMISHGGVKAYFVTGEIGIGKTRFLLQAMSYAHLIGFCTFYERAFAQKVSNPYFLCKSLLEDITRMFEPQVIMQVVKGLSVWRAGLSWFAPDIFGKVEVDEMHAAEPKRPDKHYLYEAITRFLGEISHYNPLFLFFDDLHWAGQDDIELLQYVIQNSVNSRMLI
ncbi:MAG: diguanylate cyclase, partial [Candidatus Cloacimonadota bacterium]